MTALELMNFLESAIKRHGNWQVIIPSNTQKDTGVPCAGIEVSNKHKMFLLCDDEHFDAVGPVEEDGPFAS